MIFSPYALASAPSPISSTYPITFASPGRGIDLQVRVSAPITGQNLPVIILSHGHGSSMHGYAPLVDFWAARGFVVIEPTHLDSRQLQLPHDDPRYPDIWRMRVSDMKRILNNLSIIENSQPGLAGRLDYSRIAAAGHSFGGQTTGLLLGARMIDANGEASEDMSDSRISVGLLLAAGGKGGADLSEFARTYTPYLNSDFTHLTTPTLVVAGDNDQSQLTVRGPDWFYDPYHLSPGGRALLTLFGGEHMLGGISGYDVAETTDEDPLRVALVQAVTWAFLCSALYPDNQAWSLTCAALARQTSPLGKIVSK